MKINDTFDWPEADEGFGGSPISTREDRRRLARDFDRVFGGSAAADALAASDAFMARLDAMIAEAKASRVARAAGATALAVALLFSATPADATIIVDKGDIIRGEFDGANQPMLWDSLKTHRWTPIWLDWMKQTKMPGANCLSFENSTGRNGFWYDRDGDCLDKVAGPVTPPVTPPALPPIVPPANPPVITPPPSFEPETPPTTVIPLPASLLMLLAALGGLGLVGRKRP